MKRCSGFILIFIMLISCNGEKKAGENLTDLERLNQAILNDPNNSSVYFDRALYYFENEGDESSAIKDVLRALTVDPDNPEYLLFLGKLQIIENKLAEAKASFIKVIEIDPGNIDARIELAKYYASLTNYQRGLDYINEALEIDDQYAESYFVKGLVYRKAGNDSLSISSLQTAVELDPDHLNGFIFLGMIHGEKGDPLTKSFYNSALEIDPENQQALYNLAYFEQENREYESALANYDRLLEIDSTNVFAWYNKGYVKLLYLNEYEEAISYFSKALKYEPRYYQAYYNRGLAHEQIQNYKDARLDYQAALTLESNYDLAIEGLNRLDQIN